MIDGWAVSHAALVALVRGLQFATLIVWSTAVGARGGSLLRVLFRGSDSRWDRQWSSISWFGITQAAFALRWLWRGDALAFMRTDELAAWAVLYVSSCCSAIGIMVTHGWWTDGRHRAAMWFHTITVGLSVMAAMVVS